MNAGQFFDKETAQVWSIIERYPEADLYKPIRDDGWTAFQILSHMAVASRGLLSQAKAQYRAISSGAAAPGAAPDFDLDRWNQEKVAAWANYSLADVRREWEETGRRFHEFTSSLSEADLELPVRFVTGRELKLGELIGLVTYHLRAHRQEIERGLAGEIVAPIEH